MLNNCNPDENGEKWIFERIPNNLIVFDVGARNDSFFLKYPGEVHYFEPQPEFLSSLQLRDPKINTSSFNSFGLSDCEDKAPWFPTFQSFVDRSQTLKRQSEPVQWLELRMGLKYVQDKKIEKINFLKIDTEGFELKVIRGFGEFLSNINHIQFEYGGTYIDAKICLKDVLEYLRKMRFGNFGLLSSGGIVPLSSEEDHWQYCNIIADNLNLPSIFTN
jgi:FkbM family methyltransferase